MTLIDLYPDVPEIMFENRWEKYQAYIVKHARINYKGEEVEDTNWNYYKLVAPMPDDWTYFLRNGSTLRVGRYREYVNGEQRTYNRTITIRNSFT